MWRIDDRSTSPKRAEEQMAYCYYGNIIAVVSWNGLCMELFSETTYDNVWMVQFTGRMGIQSCNLFSWSCSSVGWNKSSKVWSEKTCDAWRSPVWCWLSYRCICS